MLHTPPVEKTPLASQPLIGQVTPTIGHRLFWHWVRDRPAVGGSDRRQQT